MQDRVLVAIDGHYKFARRPNANHRSQGLPTSPEFRQFIRNQQ